MGLGSDPTLRSNIAGSFLASNIRTSGGVGIRLYEYYMNMMFTNYEIGDDFIYVNTSHS